MTEVVYGTFIFGLGVFPRWSECLVHGSPPLSNELRVSSRTLPPELLKLKLDQEFCNRPEGFRLNCPSVRSLVVQSFDLQDGLRPDTLRVDLPPSSPKHKKE